MKKTFSKRWRLNAYDFIKALALTAIVSGLDALYQGLVMYFQDPSKKLDWEQIGLVAALSGVAYILKNWGTKVPQSAIDNTKAKDTYTGSK
jgi:hypothetical protein